MTISLFADSKNMVGGHCLITANDLAAAIRIVRGCRGLDYSIPVEVRPVPTDARLP